MNTSRAQRLKLRQYRESAGFSSHTGFNSQMPYHHSSGGIKASALALGIHQRSALRRMLKSFGWLGRYMARVGKVRGGVR